MLTEFIDTANSNLETDPSINKGKSQISWTFGTVDNAILNQKKLCNHYLYSVDLRRVCFAFATHSTYPTHPTCSIDSGSGGFVAQCYSV